MLFLSSYRGNNPKKLDFRALWENFLVSERIKYLHYSGKWVNYWYWRTKEKKEIDFLEESGGRIKAYEFKWNPNARIKQPRRFLQAYEKSEFNVIHRDNFDGFLL